MNAHKLTPVQRKVLNHMASIEGQCRIITGHKKTVMAGEVIYCQTLVPFFLQHHGYIERAAGIAMWQLTDKGWTASRSKAKLRP